MHQVTNDNTTRQGNMNHNESAVKTPIIEM